MQVVAGRRQRRRLARKRVGHGADDPIRRLFRGGCQQARQGLQRVRRIVELQQLRLDQQRRRALAQANTAWRSPEPLAHQPAAHQRRLASAADPDDARKRGLLPLKDMSTEALDILTTPKQQRRFAGNRIQPGQRVRERVERRHIESLPQIFLGILHKLAFALRRTNREVFVQLLQKLLTPLRLLPGPGFSGRRRGSDMPEVVDSQVGFIAGAHGVEELVQGARQRDFPLGDLCLLLEVGISQHGDAAPALAVEPGTQRVPIPGVPGRRPHTGANLVGEQDKHRIGSRIGSFGDLVLIGLGAFAGEGVVVLLPVHDVAPEAGDRKPPPDFLNLFRVVFRIGWTADKGFTAGFVRELTRIVHRAAPLLPFGQVDFLS